MHDRAQAPSTALPAITVPARSTLAGLAIGLVLGIAASRDAGGPLAKLLALVTPFGALWLRALEMTILPLAVSLLVIGIVHTVAAARAGAMARRTLGLFVAVLLAGTLMAAVVTPLLLDVWPVPAQAVAALTNAAPRAAPALPRLGAFLASLVPANIVAAAAADGILPVLSFFALFAAALTRLAEAQRHALMLLFEGLAGAAMVMIGWVLALAPLGVFALSFAVAAAAGGAAIGLLAHYMLVVSAIGAVVMAAGCGLAICGGGLAPLAFARAMLPVGAVALSTQSSLASLPAMLGACRRLGLREDSAGFVLPLAVALLRATGPAMNLAVAIYVARLSGIALSPSMMASGVIVACLTTLGAPSISGTVSYISSIAPIALAMGLPVAPLALLVAVEMLPDLIRTLGNVVMDVAAAALVDRATG
ncbi:MAG: cation:dicarboxylase symporter family transporter [Sphingomonadales bacterium]|nr:cation:dicarboxylase symporter family transporter [Sphingomonadales bacterium]